MWLLLRRLTLCLPTEYGLVPFPPRDESLRLLIRPLWGQRKYRSIPINVFDKAIPKAIACQYRRLLSAPISTRSGWIVNRVSAGLMESRLAK